MLDLIVEHQAGIPVLMKPLSGNSRDVQALGQIVNEHIGQLQTTYGTPYLVADSALYSANNHQKLADTHMKWITRVPATLREAQAVLAQVDLQALEPLTAGYRYHELTSTYGGVAQRWVLIFSEPRQPQAQRLVDKRVRTQSDKAIKALKKLCVMTFACEADAPQALVRFEQALQATFLSARTVHALPRYGKRGRPGQGVRPAQVVYQIEGALASSLTT